MDQRKTECGIRNALRYPLFTDNVGGFLLALRLSYRARQCMSVALIPDVGDADARRREVDLPIQNSGLSRPTWLDA